MTVQFEDPPTVMVGGGSSGAEQQHAESSTTVPPTPMVKPSSGLAAIGRQKLYTNCQLLAFVALAALLILIVGLAAGLGPKRHCGKKAALTQYDIEGADEGPQVVVYEPNKPWTNHRLPKSIVPKHYDISLYPHFYTEDEKTFDGNVTIEAAVTSSTRIIILHALDLNISHVSINYRNAGDSATDQHTAPGIRRTFTFDPYQYYVIELRSRLKKDSNIEIKLNFTGSLSLASEGFYKGFFKHPVTGNKLFVAMTQFEPLDARRAFPCFDEPSLKAFFTVSIKHKRDFKALSNMPEATQVPDPANAELVLTTFQRTPVPMSTYLVAITVGQYVALPPMKTLDTQLPVSVYAPEFALEQTRYSLGVIVKIVEWMQRFFAVRYPLPKLDFVVYPTFRWTAMENWGLITFREDALLVTDETTEVDRDHVVAVIAHELAHQWFGNLVTMEWWDDLWLNEGFASFMEFPASINVGRLVDGEEYYDFLNSITEDGYRSSRSIRFLDIKTRNDISSAFDTITYQKGSTIIRMLVNAIGPAKFKNGIQEYMHQFQYRNARTSDLWATLSKEYTNANLTKVMTTWVEQKGFPLVTVEIGQGGEELVLRQEPFAIPQWHPERFDGKVPGDVAAEVNPRRWWIPINVREPSGAIRTDWMQPDIPRYTLRLPGQKPDEVKVNVNQTAFVRVNYPPVMWEKLGEKLAFDINAFEPIDRAGLVDDSLELAKAGLLSYETAFKTIRFLAKETHPLVWDTFVSQASFLNSMLYDSPQFPKLRSWLGHTIRSARNIALRNIQNMQPAQKQANPNYSRILAVLAEASLRFDPATDAQCYVDRYYKGRKWELPANRELRRAIFVAYIHTNDTEEGIAELQTVAKNTLLKQVKKQVFYAVARTKHFSFLARELEKIFNEEMNPTDFLTLATYAQNSNAHRAFLWDWARENFERLAPYHGGPTIKFMTWFVNIAKYFSTRTKYHEFEAFAKTTIRDFGDGLRARRLIEDQMRRNVFWRDHLRKDLENYLSGLQLPPVTPTTVC